MPTGVGILFYMNTTTNTALTAAVVEELDAAHLLDLPEAEVAEIVEIASGLIGEGEDMADAVRMACETYLEGC